MWSIWRSVYIFLGNEIKIGMYKSFVLIFIVNWWWFNGRRYKWVVIYVIRRIWNGYYESWRKVRSCEWVVVSFIVWGSCVWNRNGKGFLRCISCFWIVLFIWKVRLFYYQILRKV